MCIRTVTTIIILLTYTNYIYSREISEILIEAALLEVRYERKAVLDTIDIKNDFKTDIMTLKVGKTSSAFYSSELKTTDSLEVRNHDLVISRLDNKDIYNSKANLPKEKIFKNYPKGKIRTHDRFDLCNWSIDEDWEKPSWTILKDSINEIMGFQCILAQTFYRGRKWNVWFTFDIPISDGPWKLCGLPGLILYAQDSKMHYTYKAVSLKTSNIGNVEYYDYEAGSRLSINRKKSLQNKWKCLHEDLHYKIVKSGIYGIYDPNIKEKTNIPHRNYDFEETDYPHE